MRLKSLILDNFRCFEHLTLTFPRRDESFVDETSNDDLSQMIAAGTTVLVARNGEGKTAILDAIADLLGVVLSHFPNTPFPKVKETDFRSTWIQGVLFESERNPDPKPPFMRLAATAIDGNDEFTWDVTIERDESSTTKEQIPAGRGNKEIFAWGDRLIDQINAEKVYRDSFPIFAYYNTSRAVVYKKPERRRNFRKAFDRYDGYRDALKGRLDYKKMIEWIYYLEDKRRREWERRRSFDYDLLEYQTLQLAVEKILPGFRNLRTITKPLDLAIDYEDANQFKTCRLASQLSDGYKIVLTLVLDLVARALELNFDLPNETPERILATPGIVLIDEIDLHLHPSWQQRVMVDLQRTFPNIQFIVSTHSPQVVSSLPRETLRILEQGEIIPVDGQTRGVECQRIMSQIFGATPAPKDDFFVRKLEEYAKLESEGQADSPEGREKYEYLAAHFGVDYPPLQRIEIHRSFIARRKRNNAQI